MGKSWRLEETKGTGETTETNGDTQQCKRTVGDSWRLEETRETMETSGDACTTNGGRQ